MRSFLVPILVLGAAGAQASCPVAEDLATGIRFVLATGETETFQARGGDIVETFFAFDSESGARAMLAKGVYLLEAVNISGGEIEAGSRLTYSYPLAPKDMPVPMPGGGWSVTATRLEGTDLASEPQDHRFGAEVIQTYGACSYAMIPITLTYPGGNAEQREVLHYLPALGLAYLAEYHDVDVNDVYVYTSVEAVK